MVMRRPLFCALTLFSALGGIQRFNQRVLRSLAELQGPGGTGPLVHVLRDRPADIPAGHEVAAFGGSKPAFIRTTLAALHGVDCLVVDHVDLLPVAAAARLVRPRLPVLMFAHGIEVWGDPADRPVRFYEPHLMRFAVDRVACVSRYTSGGLQKAFGYPASRISLLPNAVDPLPPVSDRADAAEPVVLTVTRLSAAEPYKNVDQVIRAVARLAEAIPSLRLEIVGDGDARQGLMELAAAQGVASRVRFLGRVSDEDLAAAYRRASVFALPSTREGFGIAYLEAWQRGLPVIGSTEGAAPEVITHGADGLLVPGGDAEALAEALSTLLHDPGMRQRLGAAGYERTMAAYSGDAFRRNLAEALRLLVGH